jgi:hypothetical protein
VKEAEILTGAEYRYGKRKRRWVAEVAVLPRLRHHGWWLLHNVVAHPALGVFPAGAAIRFHDWTSRHLNRNPRLFPSAPPEIPRRGRWILHNVFGHLAIGLLPCRATFAWHDRTAEEMEVPDWV